MPQGSSDNPQRPSTVHISFIPKDAFYNKTVVDRNASGQGGYNNTLVGQVQLRELTSGNAATSLEYGRSQWEDVTQVRGCGDIWTEMWQRVRSTMYCLLPHLTPTTELVEAHREEASVLVELGVGGGVDKIFVKKYVQ